MVVQPGECVLAAGSDCGEWGERPDDARVTVTDIVPAMRKVRLE